jgi:hypothetical protein
VEVEAGPRGVVAPVGAIGAEGSGAWSAPLTATSTGHRDDAGRCDFEASRHTESEHLEAF